MGPIVVALIIFAIFLLIPKLSPEPNGPNGPDAPDTPEDSLSAALERYRRIVRLADACDSHNKSFKNCWCRVHFDEDGKPNDPIALRKIAESIGISDEEALELLSEAINPSPELVNALKTDDSNRIVWTNEFYPATLVGKEKYLTEIKKELQELGEKHKTLLAYADCLATGSVYIPTKPKNVTFEAAKGQIIGGPGLAAAKAISAENYNSSHPGGMPSSSEMQASIELSTSIRMQAVRLEEKIKELRAKIVDIEARHIDMDNPEKYAKFTQCPIGFPSLTEEGNIQIAVFGAHKTNEEPTILGKPAIVDGSVIIKAWLNGEQVGQTVYCPGGFSGNLERAGFGERRRLLSFIIFDGISSLVDSPVIPVTRELKSEDLKSITFTVEPNIIWAIQKNPAA